MWAGCAGIAEQRSAGTTGPTVPAVTTGAAAGAAGPTVAAVADLPGVTTGTPGPTVPSESRADTRAANPSYRTGATVA
ncbi:hypothetical protein [Mycobacterium riyadhense]|uniref:hypothetical protein n=1 Tax=Mycobacterium riyadhense TaxID=486698 RepID=UPI00194F49F4|nr:hypothetical protein [Mycobacterium riyadhense]